MAAAASLELTWDLNRYFPGIESKEFKEAFETLISNCAAMAKEAASGEAAGSLADRIKQFNETFERAGVLGSYLYGLTSVDSFAAGPQREQSRLAMAMADLEKARSAFTAWIGTQDVEALVASMPDGDEYRFFLEKSSKTAKHQMSPLEEALASDLGTSGRVAWRRFYGNFSSQIEVDVVGFDKKLPMSQVRALSSDVDRAVRENAYSAELKAWEMVKMPIASSLNSVKGASNTLAAKRGWPSPLHAALFNNHIDEATLDAMFTAARASLPKLRQYLKAKAKLIGVEQLAFFDIFAPISALGASEPKSWSYEEAVAFVENQFDGYSKELGDLARRSISEQWIDVFPANGKRDGAYCSGTSAGRSLVFLNFKPSFNAVSTLAHELGHAYHNYCLRDRRPLQKDTPMTLAETASTFCETIIKKAAIRSMSAEESLPILEASLQGSTQVVIDIMSRFIFEKNMMEQRNKAELSAEELCTLMRDAQIETYGDGLDPEKLHPYMWAAKPHYYGADFYNYPYMFGLLFGLGLYKVYQSEPQGFEERYSRLLSETGMGDAATLASNFGIDIRDNAFWAASLQQIEDDVDQFVKLTN